MFFCFFFKKDTKEVLEPILNQCLRLNQLNSYIQCAFSDWAQSEKMLIQVPNLQTNVKINDLSNLESSSSTGGNGEQTQSIDTHIVRWTKGAYLQHIQVPLLIIIRYIDGLIHVHNLLLCQLKESQHLNNPINVNVSNEDVPIFNQPPMSNLPNDVDMLKSKSTDLETKSKKMKLKKNSIKIQQQVANHNERILAKNTNLQDSTTLNAKSSPESKISSSNTFDHYHQSEKSIKRKLNKTHKEILENSFSSVGVNHLEMDSTQSPMKKSKSNINIDESGSQIKSHSIESRKQRRKEVASDDTSVSDQNLDCLTKFDQKLVKKKLPNNKKRSRIRLSDDFSDSNESNVKYQRSSSLSNLKPSKMKKKRQFVDDECKSERGVNVVHTSNTYTESNNRNSAENIDPDDDFINDDDDDDEDDEDTDEQNHSYQPKRIRSSFDKSNPRLSPRSVSSGSCSPTPFYRPSSIGMNKNQRRRAQSINPSTSISNSNTKSSTGLIKKHVKECEVNQKNSLKTSSMGCYSPTKGSLSNNTHFISSSSNSSSQPPVYNVSRISPKLKKNAQLCRPTAKANKNQSLSSNIVHSRSGDSKTDAPPFYSRWLKDRTSLKSKI